MRQFLYVDTSGLNSYVREMKEAMKPANFEKCMAITVKEVGAKMRTQAVRLIRKDYRIGYGAARSQFGIMRYSGSGSGITAMMDVIGPRIKIPNSGGGNAKRKTAIYVKKGLKARIAIVEEPLPTSGPKAHYVLRKSGKVITFTGGKYTIYEKFHTKNATEKLYPSKKKAFRQGVGIAVPQMPMNRSADAIQEWACDELLKRLNHNIMAMGKGYISER